MTRIWCISVLIGLFGAAGPLHAQWFELSDSDTNTVCGVVNADNVRLVIGEAGSNLVLITGSDRVLANTLVTDPAAEVFVDDQPVGFIEFATDQTGRRRVFWVTEIGNLYQLEPDGEPVATRIFPEEVVGDCDPCEFWDHPAEADCQTGGIDSNGPPQDVDTCGADCQTDGIDSNGPPQDVGRRVAGALVTNLCGAGAGLAMAGMFSLAMTRCRGRRR